MRSAGRRITLPAELVRMIERYNITDYSNDPTKLGALNAVAYIGERVAALLKDTK